MTVREQTGKRANSPDARSVSKGMRTNPKLASIMQNGPVLKIRTSPFDDSVTQQVPCGTVAVSSNHFFSSGAGASVGGTGVVAAAAAGAAAVQPLAQGAAAVQPVAQGAAAQQVLGALQHLTRAGLQQRTFAGRQQLRASAEPPTLNTAATATAAAKPNIRLILTSLKILETQTWLPTLGVPTLPQQP